MGILLSSHYGEVNSGRTDSVFGSPRLDKYAYQHKTLAMIVFLHEKKERLGKDNLVQTFICDSKGMSALSPSASCLTPRLTSRSQQALQSWGPQGKATWGQGDWQGLQRRPCSV